MKNASLEAERSRRVRSIEENVPTKSRLANATQEGTWVKTLRRAAPDKSDRRSQVLVSSH